MFKVILKKSLYVFLAVVMTFSLSISAFADDSGDYMIGLSEEPPVYSETDGITPYGYEKPGVLDGWNVAKKGKKEFSGYVAEWSQKQYLYTNNYFTGKTSYTISVTNEKSKDSLQYAIMSMKGKVIYSYTLPAGTTTTFTFKRDKKSQKFYLRFEKPMSAHGYVS